MNDTTRSDEVVAAEEAPQSDTRWIVPRWLHQLGGWSWRLLVFGVVAYWTLRWLVLLRAVVLPVLIALLVTALLSPLKKRLTDVRVPNILASWLVLVAGFAFVVGLIAVASFFIGNELADTAQWEETRDELRTWLQDGPANLTADEVADFEDRGRNWLTSGAGGVSSDRARLLVELIGGFFLSVILTFFFVKDGAQLWSWITDRFSPRRRDSVRRAGFNAFAALRGYVRGVAITGVIDAVLIGAVLLTAGVPLALPLAVLTFFGAFFPIVGATVVGGAGALVALVANGPRTAIIVAAATLIIQQLEGDLIMPAVMRRTVNLHPAVVLVALAVGATLGGIAGAFVAVPVAAMFAAGARSLRV